MTLEEVKQFFADNQDDQAVKDYIGGFVTPDRVKEFLESDEGKKLLQPKLDQYFTKGLETWKANTLPKIVDEKIREKYPDETEEQKRIKQLEQQFSQEQKTRKRKEIESKAIRTLTQKNYPVELVDFISADDEEELNAKIETLTNTLDGWAKKVVDERFKESGRSPRTPEYDKGKKNPWSKKDWNLTEQGRMTREEPELAKYFRENTRRE